MLDTFVDSLYGMSGMSAVVAGIIAIALGLLECYFGYRIFKVQVGIIGFLAGFAIGTSALTSLTSVAWLPIASGVLVGILLFVVSMKIYKAGVFLVVAFFAYLLAILFSQNVWFALIIAVALGLLGVFLTRHVIIIVTALGGAGIVSNAAMRLFSLSQAAPSWLNYAGIAVMAVLAISGILAQYRNSEDPANS